MKKKWVPRYLRAMDGTYSRKVGTNYKFWWNSKQFEWSQLKNVEQLCMKIRKLSPKTPKQFTNRVESTWVRIKRQYTTERLVVCHFNRCWTILNAMSLIRRLANVWQLIIRLFSWNVQTRGQFMFTVCMSYRVRILLPKNYGNF